MVYECLIAFFALSRIPEQGNNSNKLLNFNKKVNKRKFIFLRKNRKNTRNSKKMAQQIEFECMDKGQLFDDNHEHFYPKSLKASKTSTASNRRSKIINFFSNLVFKPNRSKIETNLPFTKMNRKRHFLSEQNEFPSNTFNQELSNSISSNATPNYQDSVDLDQLNSENLNELQLNSQTSISSRNVTTELVSAILKSNHSAENNLKISDLKSNQSVRNYDLDFITPLSAFDSLSKLFTPEYIIQNDSQSVTEEPNKASTHNLKSLTKEIEYNSYLQNQEHEKDPIPVKEIEHIPFSKEVRDPKKLNKTWKVDQTDLDQVNLFLHSQRSRNNSPFGFGYPISSQGRIPESSCTLSGISDIILKIKERNLVQRLKSPIDSINQGFKSSFIEHPHPTYRLLKGPCSKQILFNTKECYTKSCNKYQEDISEITSYPSVFELKDYVNKEETFQHLQANKHSPKSIEEDVSQNAAEIFIVKIPTVCIDCMEQSLSINEKRRQAFSFFERSRNTFDSDSKSLNLDINLQQKINQKINAQVEILEPTINNHPFDLEEALEFKSICSEKGYKPSLLELLKTNENLISNSISDVLLKNLLVNLQATESPQGFNEPKFKKIESTYIQENDTTALDFPTWEYYIFETTIVNSNSSQTVKQVSSFYSDKLNTNDPETDKNTTLEDISQKSELGNDMGLNYSKKTYLRMSTVFSKRYSSRMHQQASWIIEICKALQSQLEDIHVDHAVQASSSQVATNIACIDSLIAFTSQTSQTLCEVYFESLTHNSAQTKQATLQSQNKLSKQEPYLEKLCLPETNRVRLIDDFPTVDNFVIEFNHSMLSLYKLWKLFTQVQLDSIQFQIMKRTEKECYSYLMQRANGVFLINEENYDLKKHQTEVNNKARKNKTKIYKNILWNAALTQSEIFKKLFEVTVLNTYTEIAMQVGVSFGENQLENIISQIEPKMQCPVTFTLSDQNTNCELVTITLNGSYFIRKYPTFFVKNNFIYVNQILKECTCDQSVHINQIVQNCDRLPFALQGEWFRKIELPHPFIRYGDCRQISLSRLNFTFCRQTSCSSAGPLSKQANLNTQPIDFTWKKNDTDLQHFSSSPTQITPFSFISRKSFIHEDENVDRYHFYNRINHQSSDYCEFNKDVTNYYKNQCFDKSLSVSKCYHATEKEISFGQPSNSYLANTSEINLHPEVVVHISRSRIEQEQCLNTNSPKHLSSMQCYDFQLNDESTQNFSKFGDVIKNSPLYKSPKPDQQESNMDNKTYYLNNLDIDYATYFSEQISDGLTGSLKIIQVKTDSNFHPTVNGLISYDKLKELAEVNSPASDSIQLSTVHVNMSEDLNYSTNQQNPFVDLKPQFIGDPIVFLRPEARTLNIPRTNVLASQDSSTHNVIKDGEFEIYEQENKCVRQATIKCFPRLKETTPAAMIISNPNVKIISNNANITHHCTTRKHYTVKNLPRIKERQIKAYFKKIQQLSQHRQENNNSDSLFETMNNISSMHTFNTFKRGENSIQMFNMDTYFILYHDSTSLSMQSNKLDSHLLDSVNSNQGQRDMGNKVSLKEQRKRCDYYSHILRDSLRHDTSTNLQANTLSQKLKTKSVVCQKKIDSKNEPVHLKSAKNRKEKNRREEIAFESHRERMNQSRLETERYNIFPLFTKMKLQRSIRRFQKIPRQNTIPLPQLKKVESKNKVCARKCIRPLMRSNQNTKSYTIAFYPSVVHEYGDSSRIVSTKKILHTPAKLSPMSVNTISGITQDGLSNISTDTKLQLYHTKDSLEKEKHCLELCKPNSLTNYASEPTFHSNITDCIVESDEICSNTLITNSVTYSARIDDITSDINQESLDSILMYSSFSFEENISLDPKKKKILVCLNNRRLGYFIQANYENVEYLLVKLETIQIPLPCLRKKKIEPILRFPSSFSPWLLADYHENVNHFATVIKSSIFCSNHLTDFEYSQNCGEKGTDQPYSFFPICIVDGSEVLVGPATSCIQITIEMLNLIISTTCSLKATTFCSTKSQKENTSSSTFLLKETEDLSFCSYDRSTFHDCSSDKVQRERYFPNPYLTPRIFTISE